MIFKRFGKLVFTYPRYIFYHALSLFATLSGPPCHYRYMYIYIYSLEEGPPDGGWDIVSAFSVCFHNFNTLFKRFSAPFWYPWGLLGNLWVALGTTWELLFYEQGTICLTFPMPPGPLTLESTNKATPTGHKGPLSISNCFF